MIGNTGSGKTTFAHALARRLNVPHIELDELFWKPGWQESTTDEFKERVVAAIRGDGWVVDGNYRSKLGMLVLDQADAVVWLDLPLNLTMRRLFRRTFRRVRTREELWGTNVDSWRGAFLSRDSLFWWQLKTHYRWRRRLPEALASYPVVRLQSPAEVDRYLAEVV